MTNNTRTHPYNYQSQQDMRKIANTKNPNITSLPRNSQNNWQQQQESSLTQNHIYAQPITANGSVTYATPKYNTTDRHMVRLTQDHFNHNNSLKYPGQYSQTLDGGDYLHNNSHYSLPVDHNNQHDASPRSQSPIPPTPPPPALPLRNGSCNTTGRRATFSALNGNQQQPQQKQQQPQHNHINNNNNSSVATLHKSTTLNNNINNNLNHTGSLRHQCH